MIHRLFIKNYAIIEELEMKFSDHLTIITGETGAGKSILLGALGLIMGNRADARVLYNQQEKCVVEGYFDLSNYDLREFFEQHEIDYERESVVRRELTPSGKSRTFINDTPVTLPILRQFTGSLIDLHEQFDTLDIHDVSFQLRMIDALADNKALLKTYDAAFKLYRADKRRLADMIAKTESAARETEFIRFQLDEFNKAELIAGEQEKIETELARLTNAEVIKRALSSAFRAISEAETSVVSQLQELAMAVGAVKKYNTEISPLHERHEGLIYELQEIADEYERVAEDTEFDGARILEIQSRLDVIYRLQKKHAVLTVEDLIAIQENLNAQLSALSDLSSEIVALEQSLVRQEVQLQEAAAQLRDRRLAVIPSFEKQVEELLQQLSMEHARLQIQLTELADWTPTGKDDINYLFAANKGSRLQPIKEVASGGELSRLTLCCKSLVASAIPLPTLIFDEIDSGVSGDVAIKMGAILQKLSDHHQVVVITHSPQVASKADTHYFVYKTVKEDRTITSVRLLNMDERVRSIATMLSQNPPSASAIENAKELLSGVRKTPVKIKKDGASSLFDA